ncbi:MAG: hypothetical protein QOH42_163, partial [Blastocatellia bacterium]|nr:hypothetical protein [Blastocatellia bacterium]
TAGPERERKLERRDKGEKSKGEGIV